MVIEVLDLQTSCPLNIFQGPRARLWYRLAFMVQAPGLPRPVFRADGSLRAHSPWTASLLTPLLLQVQNLGFFPIHGVMMKITVPIATRGGNRLLMLKDFFTDQVAVFPREQGGRGTKETEHTPRHPGAPGGWACLGGGRKGELGVRFVTVHMCVPSMQVNTSCNIWGNSTEYRSTPTEEDLSHAPQRVSIPTPRAKERGSSASPFQGLLSCPSVAISETVHG